MVGQLLGLKTTLNEFFAYAALEGMQDGMAEKSVIIATYALCGFANFASIGIQIGGISAIAPGQRKNLTELGVPSLIGGTVACFLTAIIAGVMYTPSQELGQKSNSSIESGVSKELSLQRSEQIDAIHYDLMVNIPRNQSEAIEGELDLSFNWKGGAEEVLLDFRQEEEYLKTLVVNGEVQDLSIVNDHIPLKKKL